MGETYSIIESIKRNLSGRKLPGEAAQLRMAPSFRGEMPSIPPNADPIRESAVLIALFPYKNEISTLLIKRPVYTGTHSGQVSFPGGKFDESDVRLQNTAIRETHEEAGIATDAVIIIGSLSPLYIPVSNTRVTPFVAELKELPSLNLNRREVEYPIIVPVSDFKRAENIKEKTLLINDKKIIAPYFDIQNEFVWGATAMIISELTEMF